MNLELNLPSSLETESRDPTTFERSAGPGDRAGTDSDTGTDTGAGNDAGTDSDVAGRLQSETTAVRLRIRWPGVRKTLSEDQKQQAASTFDADIKSVSASKKLLDTSHPAFRAATAVKTQAVDYWKRSTLPYIEPGVRLLRRRDIAAFDTHMTPISPVARWCDCCHRTLVVSRDQLFDDAGGTIGGDDLLLVTVWIDDFFVVQTKQMHHRGLKVVGCHDVFDRAVAEIVGLAERHASAHSAAGQPDAESLAIVIAARFLRLRRDLE